MSSTFTPNKGLELQATGDNTNTWGERLNTNVISELDLMLGGNIDVDVSGAVNVTPTTDQLLNVFQHLVGVLTGDIAYLMPAVGGFYLISNETTGAHTITVKCSGQTGVVVPQGTRMWVYGDGEDWHVADTYNPGFLLAANNLSDLANIATARSNLGVTATGQDTTYCYRANNLSDVANAAMARTNLAVLGIANNLSDLANAATARSNLGLGTAAVLNAGTAPNNVPQLDGSGNLTTAGTISDSAGNVRTIPLNSQTTGYVLQATDAGKVVPNTTGGWTIPSGVFSVGQAVTLYNNSGSSQTVTQGVGVTLQQAASTNTGDRTLSGHGLATILCVASNTFVITGAGLS